MKLKHLFLAFATMTLFVSCKKDVPVTGIALDSPTITFTTAGQKDTLTATLAPADAISTVVWSSSNTAIATVEGNGLTAVVTAVGNGTAKIMAKVDNIFSAECAVTVNIGGASGSGEGTEVKPFTVEQAIATQGGSKWVEGVIVGYINGIAIGNAAFAVPTDTIQTEILIASTVGEKSIDKCLVVQLPAGAVRTGLDLYTTPANLGKTVKLYGALEVYFGKPGMKSTAYFEIKGGISGGTKPVDTSNAILSESFAASIGQFTVSDVLIPEGGTYVWKWDTNKYMKASAFIGSAKASEGWLISPVINLTGKTNANLSFEHTGKYFTADKATEQVVLVSTNYTSGLPSTATWTTLTVPTWPTGNDWSFVNSGDISLSSVGGNTTVRIAFKFSSTTAGSATWEIKNFIVK